MEKLCTECNKPGKFYFNRRICSVCCQKHWKPQANKRLNSESGKRKLVLSQRKHNLKKQGLSLENYFEMFAEQKGVCAICQQPERSLSNKGGAKRLSVDHCHKTGRIRGLLCARCNTVLGHMEDNVNLLEKCIKYLLSS